MILWIQQPPELNSAWHCSLVVLMSHLLPASSQAIKQGRQPGGRHDSQRHLSRSLFVFWITRARGAGHRLATQRNQANPTAGGPRQSLTSEMPPTPLIQEVPCARTKAWELKPYASQVCYSDCHPHLTHVLEPCLEQ
jgi:hypothetical protein